MFENNERGQVGIGTLIVFIALVLVAAIAAGVLINTAGFLQTQAEATGEESTEQVTNNVNIVGATGEADGSGDQINDLEIHVSKSPGSGDIDLEDGTIELIGDDDAVTLDMGSGDVTLTPDGELFEDEDRVTIGLQDSASDDLPLEEGDELQVTIETADGGQASTVLRVPDILDADEGVSL